MTWRSSYLSSLSMITSTGSLNSATVPVGTLTPVGADPFPPFGGEDVVSCVAPGPPAAASALPSDDMLTETSVYKEGRTSGQLGSRARAVIDHEVDNDQRREPERDLRSWNVSADATRGKCVASSIVGCIPHATQRVSARPLILLATGRARRNQV